mmetsp:Transcript_63246/g.181406  ORF Transcript_63246/g.181406 Transcript_63246/m.181406 type:complete len:115 (+) Transcript_63246:1399-1743(+)
MRSADEAPWSAHLASGCPDASTSGGPVTAAAAAAAADWDGGAPTGSGGSGRRRDFLAEEGVPALGERERERCTVDWRVRTRRLPSAGAAPSPPDRRLQDGLRMSRSMWAGTEQS